MGMPSAYGGRGPLILRVTWALVAIYTLLLALRSFVRIKIVKSGGAWSLIWACVSWILGVISAGLITHEVLQGMGNHIEVVLAAGTDIVDLGRIQLVFFVIQSMAFPIARISVLAFLLDVQGPTHLISRIVLISICVFGLLTAVVSCFLYAFQCTPAEHAFNPAVPGTCSQSVALADVDFGIFSGAWGVMTDFILAVYPIYLLRSLQIAPRIKFLVTLLMGLGIFSTVCSALRTYQLEVLPKSTDYTYDTGPLYYWAPAELWTILIAGSMPPLWPLVQYVRRTTSRPSRYNSRVRSMMRARRSDAPSHSRTLSHAAHADGRPFARLGSSHGSDDPLDNGIEVRKDINVAEEQVPERDVQALELGVLPPGLAR